MSLSEIRVNTLKTRTGVGTITYTETGPVITGIATASNFKTGSTNVHSTGVELANINTGGSTATFGGAISGTSATLSGALSGTTASFSGNVSIGGTLTYEDVTNIDSIGIITAKSGIHLEDYIFHKGDTNTSIGFPSADTLFVKTAGVERVRITSTGLIGIGTDNPGSEIHIVADAPVLKVTPTNWQSGLRIDVLGLGNNASNNQLFRVQKDGTTKLQLNEDGDLVITGDDNAELKLKCGTSTGNNIIAFLNSAGTTKGNIFYDSDNNFMVFKTDGTASSNERLRITSGGDVLLGTDHATIGMNTADGSDNRVWSLCGGSDASQSRGAVITLYGNEAPINSNYGTLSLKSGNTNSGFIDFWTQGAKKAEITKEGCFRIQSTYNGSAHSSNAYPCLNITNLQGTYTANNILGGVTFGKAAGHSNGVRAGMLAIYQGNGSNAGNVGAHLSFWTSANGAGDGNEKLFISDTGVLCTGNYRGLLDQTMGSVQINGGTSGGRLSFRGTTTSAGGGLGEIHGFWDTNKVASMLFHAGGDTSNKDDGEIRMYTRHSGQAAGERLRITRHGAVCFGITDHATNPLDTISGFAGTRNVNILSFPTSVSPWSSWVGTNLYHDGSNFVKHSDHLGQNWGNIAGIKFEGANHTGAIGMRFIVDLPQGNAGGNISLGSAVSAIDNKSAMNIYATGAIVKPKQPSCTLYEPHAIQINVANDNVPIGYQHVEHNTGMTVSNGGSSDAARANSRIQVPVAGRYLISSQMSGSLNSAASIDANDGVYWYLRKNGGNSSAYYDGMWAWDTLGSTTGQEFDMSFCIVLSLAASDYLEVAYTNIHTNFNVNLNKGYFSVHLLS